MRKQIVKMRLFDVVLVLIIAFLTAVYSDDPEYMNEQLHELTRWNFNGDETSSDWSEYDVFDCKNSGEDRKCELDIKMESGGAESTESGSSYVQGVIMWGNFNIVAALLIIFFTFIYVLYELFTCACDFRSKYSKAMLEKTNRGAISACCTATVSIVLLIVLVLGMSIGYANLNSFFTAVPDTGEGFSGLLQQQTAGPLQNFIIGSVSLVIAPFLVSTNNTVYNATNFTAMENDLTSIGANLNDIISVTKNLDARIDTIEIEVNKTAALLGTISDQISVIEISLNVLYVATDGFKVALETNPPQSNSEMNSKLYKLEWAIANLTASFTPIYQTLGNATIKSLENALEILNTNLITVTGSLNGMQPPIYDLLIVQVGKINESIVDTSDLFDSQKEYDSLTADINSAKDSTVNGQDKVDTALNTLDSVNFTDYYVTVKEYERLIDDSVAQINFTVLHIAFDAPISWTNYINPSDYTTLLQSTLTTINSVDFTGIKNTINSAQADLQSIDFDELRSSVNKTVELEEEAYELLDDGLLVVQNFQAFLSQGNQLPLAVAELSQTYLQSLAEVSGIGSVVIHIGTVTDRLNVQLNDVFNGTRGDLFEDAKFDSTDLAKDWEPTANVLDRLQSAYGEDKDNLKVGGSLYYLLNIVNKTRDRQLRLGDQRAYSVFYDKDGNEYKDSDGDRIYCLTAGCWDQQKTEFEEESEYGAAFYSVLGLLYLPFWLIFAFGACAICVPFIPSQTAASGQSLNDEINNGKETRCCSRLKECPATTYLVLAIFFVPLFLILTAIGMPAMMVASDGCDNAGAPGLVHNYLTAFGNDYCTSVLDGTGTLDDCIFDSDGDFSYNISVDIQGLIDSSTGYLSVSECIARPFGDPFTFPSTQLQSQTHRIFNDFALNITEDANLRPPMAANFLTAASNFATAFNFFLEETKEVFNCNSLQAVYLQFTDPICTDLVGYYGWFFACLYLACYVICCGGIPAACLIQYRVRWDQWESENNNIVTLTEDLPENAYENIQIAEDVEEDGSGYDEELRKDLYPTPSTGPSAPFSDNSDNRISVSVDMLDVYPTAGQNASNSVNDKFSKAGTDEYML